MTYACILMDPPWAERGGCGRGAEDHYPVMSRHEIAAVVTGAPCWRPAPDAHLWCWTTMSSLPDALWLVDALGFRYVTHAVWHKDEIGLGQYLRGQHELLLLAVRGSGAAVRTDARNISSVIKAPVPRERGRRIHSRKPDAAYAMVEARSIGPRLEMFARTTREGWTAWGNEVPS